MARLEGQVAIVTGGALGIGGAAARRLAEGGGRKRSSRTSISTRGRPTRGGFGRPAARPRWWRADVGSHDDIRGMIERAVELWGRLDILVSNAYSPAHGPDTGSALDVTEERWDFEMGVLTKSIFLGVKYAVPEMRKTGAGSIVNIASVHGMLMAPGKLVYEAGKSAVIGMTRQMATDFGPMNIRVNAICPGHIVTERIQASYGEDRSGAHFLEDQYPLRRVGLPVDVANAIVFLCSDEASFITGHALAVDGGLTVQLQEDFGVRQAHYAQQTPGLRLPY